MTISISVKTNALDVIRALESRRNQLPFALATALNRTARAVVAAEQREMRDVFDRPKPWTLNSVTYWGASKTDLTATVFLKSDPQDRGAPADKYLAAEIKGGSRQPQRFELALRAVGVLPEGYRVVPGAAAKMDAYGNIAPSQILQILSYFRTFNVAGFDANATPASIARRKRGTKARAGFVYFAGRPADGRLPLGIWQRVGSGSGAKLHPIMIFVDGALYQAIFDFVYTAEITVAKEFSTQFHQAVSDALATARP